ncbi:MULTISPECIES: hypothetical protein [unclassified Salmonella]|uniref:hypothetical protein n=1 Tax=Salmonella TaxID=590 RepID=UPI003F683049
MPPWFEHTREGLSENGRQHCHMYILSRKKRCGYACCAFTSRKYTTTARKAD